MTAALALAYAVAGGAAGRLFVPWAANALLRRSYERSVSWWWDSYGAYRAFREERPEPLAGGRGEEGALAIWRDDALAMARAGTLARERVRALAEAGLKADESGAARSEAEQRARCAFAPGPWGHAACALGCAGWFGAAALCGLPAAVCAALLACGAAMAVAVACDVQARIIPLETCLALAVGGAAFQLGTGGVRALAAGALIAAVVVAGCAAANRLLGRGGGVPVGHGDVRCMAALSLASGPAAPFGLLVCYGCAAAFSLAGLAAGRLAWRGGIPMAPFLALWLAVVPVCA
ncbi:prepilin peptidase [Arabiibacter massiliensis]|uniref:prepilin peptidase n=1 Tax=Arabiibacter massiliensis TaxID=1870985 RepID=UPI0009B9E67B|nr:prepilin peptidase [Arabiibacter massiliensis]